MNGVTTPRCGYCGRPVIGFGVVYDGGMAYHPECTHGPDYAKQVYQMPPLTAEQVRQIVREELANMPPIKGITAFSPLNAASNMGVVFNGMAKPWNGL